MRGKVVITSLLVGILILSGFGFSDAYAMTKADLIASISEKTTSGDSSRAKNADCTVTSTDGSIIFDSDSTNRLGITHLKLKSPDGGDLPNQVILTCVKGDADGSKTLDVKRFIKAKLTIQPENNSDSFFDVFFDVFTIDSFFDILLPLQDFHTQTSGVDSFFDVFVELDDVTDQMCPPGQFVKGIDSVGKIICDDLPLSQPPDCSALDHCSGHGQCVEDNMCQCDAGYGGDDCSVPPDTCNAVNCEQCVPSDPNMCQSCLPGFFMGSSGQCTEQDNDFDGYTTEEDCDDNDPSINPGVDEVPGNGIDDNCNGDIDEGFVDCNDGNICTSDFFDPASLSCVNQINPGALCDDGNPATVNDMCDSTGICTGQLASPIEIDSYSSSTAQFTLILPDASQQIISLSGPSTIHANFIGTLGSVGNLDDDDAEEVQTELVSMSLTGTSPFGPISMTLNPNISSLGQTEENTNNISGFLELPPFTSGTGNSFFDVFFELNLGGIRTFNISPVHIESPVTFKPVAQGETLSSTVTVPLINENGEQSGFAISGLSYTPNPFSGPFCGDGNVDPGEQCDDGNQINGDGCSSLCLADQCTSDADCPIGQFCTASTSGAPLTCTDGIPP